MSINDDINNVTTVAQLRTLRLATKASFQTAKTDLAAALGALEGVKAAHAQAQNTLLALGDPNVLKKAFYTRLGELTKNSIEV